jgi:hypothetical protein
VGVGVLVEIGVTVGVLVAVVVGVSVEVLVAVGVAVGMFVDVFVGVSVGVWVTVFVAVFVGVSVGVLVEVFVGVSVGVFVDVLVGVFVGVSVGVFVAVLVGVFVAVLVGVAVDVFVGVGVGARTITVSEAVLFVSLSSIIIPFGSTATVFARLPDAFGVTENITLNDEFTGIKTVRLLAAQLKVVPVIEQLIVPIGGIPPFVTVTAPYPAPPGNASLMITLPFVKDAAAIPVLFTVIVQLNEFPNTILLPMSLAFVTIRSAIERKIVLLSVFDVIPFTVAEAVFVMEPVVISAMVTM